MKKNGSAVVRKPRSKVSRACENCRRRKIKCTGKQPCNNCITYSCECVYSVTSNGGGAKGENIAPSQVSSSETLQDYADSSSSGSVSSQSKGARQSETTNGAAKDQVFDPVMDCVHETSIKDRNNICGTQSTFDAFAESMNSTSSRATMTAQRDLASMNPIQPVFGDNGLYNDDVEFQNQVIQLQTSLKHLKAIPNASKLIQESVINVEKQVEQLVANWEPEFDVSRFANINAYNGIHGGTTSIETHLMKNKYTDQTHLTNFSVWTDNTANEKSTGGNGDNSKVAKFFGGKPLVDVIFGLYSPLQSLSLRGIGHFFQKCAGGPESKDKTIQLKESLYLLLRFFDICMKDLSQACVSIASPLDNYLRRRNLIDLTANSFPAVGNAGCATNKDLVALLISRLPQPFVKNLTAVSTEQLYSLSHDDFAMFNILVKMFDCHKKGFNMLMVRLTSHKTPDAPSPEITFADNEAFLNYCEEEQILLALCYNYYNSTLYHFDEYIGNLNYYELLISLLETQIWLEEKYGYEKVLDVAVSYSRRLGLSRWEFYVGLDEETAERRRRAWWKLYCIEKMHVCKTGRISSIDDSIMNCLLPKEFRDLNFADSRDFLARVHLVQRSWAFDSMSVSALKSYGECAIAQVISSFYAKVLYAERYTSIRNTAKPHYLKSLLLSEVFDEIQKFKEQFDAIKNQTSKLFDIASSSQSYGILISEDDRADAVHFALIHGCVFFSVLTSTSNLISRLFVKPKSPCVVEHCMKFAALTYGLWRDMTGLLLSIDNDYTIGRVFVNYGIVCMLVASIAFEKCTFIRSIDEVVTFLRVFKRLRQVAIYIKNKGNPVMMESKAYLSHGRILTFVGITANNMLLGYMHDNELDKISFFNIIQQCAPDISELLALILNPKSDIYELLMQPVENCGFHLDVKRLLEKEVKPAKAGFEEAARGYPKTAVQLTPSGSDVSPYNAAVSQGVSPASPGYLGTSEPLHTKLPPIKTLANTPNPASYEPTPSQMAPILNQGEGVKSSDVPAGQKNKQNPVDGTSASYNLGTLDDFVNNGNLDDVFNTLWSDLDHNIQSVFGMDELSPYLSKTS